MDFLELVKIRRSVRRYSSQPVQRQQIDRCIEAARLAPSACNSQPWGFIVVDDPDLKIAVGKAAYSKMLSLNRFAADAAVIVAVTCGKSRLAARIGGAIKRKKYNLIDVGIAAEHLCLAAVEQGLGTCMLGWFDERKVKRLLNVDRDKKVVLLITVGHPADTDTNGNVPKSKRKDFSEIVKYNT
jgi:nitroreductase